jgi:hypothetical protein
MSARKTLLISGNARIVVSFRRAIRNATCGLLILRLSDLLFVFGSERQKPLRRRIAGNLFGEPTTLGDLHEKISALTADLIRWLSHRTKITKSISLSVRFPTLGTKVYLGTLTSAAQAPVMIATG